VLKTLVLQNVVCPIAIPPAAFPIANFAEKLELGPVEQQVQVPEFAIWEYAGLRLQVRPDRLQLGFRQQASQDLVRQAVEEFVKIVRTDFKTNVISFNANLGLELDEGEPDPTAQILDAKALTQRLQGQNPRGGVWLVYQDDDSSRWWIELVPVPDKDNRWLFSINRHYDNFPEDEESQNAILDWFQNAKMHLSEQCNALMEG
jgi:hypothetical protein